MPHLHMTPVVRLTLSGLFVYVVLMLGLIGVKFVRDFTAASSSAPPADQRETPASGRQ